MSMFVLFSSPPAVEWKKMSSNSSDDSIIILLSGWENVYVENRFNQ
jgi:hypothetical protein